MKLGTLEIIHQFLLANADVSKPVLLAISGGPDSLALLHLMLECRKRVPISIGIAHVDHGWRAESKEEARQLSALAAEWGVPFHLKVLDPANTQGNIEDFCRRERLAFFGELCQRHGYQAVVLAHHADDQAETVLKRLFEGASIPNLSGMRPVSAFEGVAIWRPLLAASKRELAMLADKLSVAPFADATNHDPRFMRARMRSRIMPALSETFGKEIVQPLVRLSEEAAEWSGYLDQVVRPIMDSVEASSAGLFFDMIPFKSRHPVELKYAIRKICKSAGFVIPRALTETALDLLATGKGNKQLWFEGKCLHIDRGCLFIPTRTLDEGMWDVEVRQVPFKGQGLLTGWREVWHGRLEVYLPPGEYTVGKHALTAACPGGASLSKVWTAAKVPAFLRQAVPVVWTGASVAHEFLSGRVLSGPKPGEECVCVSLRLRGL